MTPPPTFRAFAYPPLGRLVVAALFGIAMASLPAILAVVLLADDPPATAGDVMRLFRDLTLLPFGLGCLVRHAFRAEVVVRPDGCVVARPGVRLEVPLDAIVRLRPWRLPMPGPGCTLYLRTGGRLRDGGLALRDPGALLAALAAVGVSAAPVALADPAIAWARARAARPRRRWYHYAARFPLFALLPTAVLFNLHQHVAYGHALGEYYLHGAASYGATLLTYHTTLTIYLVLYAAVWRGPAEATTLAAVRFLPAAAERWRWGAERVVAVAYYGGVPVLLALRFVPW